MRTQVPRRLCLPKDSASHVPLGTEVEERSLTLQNDMQSDAICGQTVTLADVLQGLGKEAVRYCIHRNLAGTFSQRLRSLSESSAKINHANIWLLVTITIRQPCNQASNTHNIYAIIAWSTSSEHLHASNFCFVSSLNSSPRSNL